MDELARDTLTLAIAVVRHHGMIVLDRDVAVDIDSELSAIAHGRQPDHALCNRLYPKIRDAYRNTPQLPDWVGWMD